jgi:hypothetical protein
MPAEAPVTIAVLSRSLIVLPPHLPENKPPSIPPSEPWEEVAAVHMVIDKEVAREACAGGLPIGEWVPKQQGGRFHEPAWIVRPPVGYASARRFF